MTENAGAKEIAMQPVVDQGPGDILVEENAEPPLHRNDAIPGRKGGPGVERYRVPQA